MTENWNYFESTDEPSTIEVCTDIVRIRRNIQQVEKTDEMTGETYHVWTGEEKEMSLIEYEVIRSDVEEQYKEARAVFESETDEVTCDMDARILALEGGE